MEVERPDRSATIYSVAKRAGVSIATVSRVMQGTNPTSERVREQVLAAAAELNYVPRKAARSLAFRRAEAHALVLGDLTGPYHLDLLAGYENEAAKHGQSVVLVVVDTKEEPERAVWEAVGRVDGVIFGPSALTDEVIAAVSATTPVVVAGRDAVANCAVVQAENFNSAKELTLHLLDHARTKLLFVGDPESSADVRERHAGFEAAHLESGIRPLAPPIRVRQVEASGPEVVRTVLDLKTPEGLVCANDELALSSIRELAVRGLSVPADLAIVGWDDLMASKYITPGLTTVRQPVRTLGATAARLLHSMVIDQQEEREIVVLPTELVFRQSCGCR